MSSFWEDASAALRNMDWRLARVMEEGTVERLGELRNYVSIQSLLK